MVIAEAGRLTVDEQLINLTYSQVVRSMLDFEINRELMIWWVKVRCSVISFLPASPCLLIDSVVNRS